MGLPSSLVLELRSDQGNNLNGGAFDPSVTSPGTDLTYPVSSPISYSDLTIAATTTNVSSAARAFIAADVGNTINITSGTGFTAGRYSVRSVAAGVATLDAAVGTAGSTAGVGTLGGAWGTYDGLMAYLGSLSTQVAGWTIWVRLASGYTSTTLAPTYSCNGSAALRINYRGYGTARGDAGVPTITASGLSYILYTASYWTVRQIKLTAGASPGAQRGFVLGGESVRAEDCFASGMTGGSGFSSDIPGQCLMTRCYASNCQTGFVTQSYAHFLSNCVAETCVTGFNLNGSAANGADMSYLLATNCTGDGFVITSSLILYNCVSTGSGLNGFNYTGNGASDFMRLINCYAGQSGAYGFKTNVPAIVNSQEFRTCGFYSSTSGHTNLTPALPATCVALSAAPFVNAASSDYRLNNAAGGGALLRAAGVPITLGPAWMTPWNTVANAADIGVYQHATPPLGLVVNATGTNPVLTWDADSRAVTGYVISRGTTATNKADIATVALATTTYTDTTATSGTFFYGVASY